MTATKKDVATVSKIRDEILSRADSYGCASARLVVIPREDTYSLHSGIFTFLKKEEKIEEEKRDYGNLILLKKKLEIKAVLQILSELAEKKTLTLEGLPTLEVEGSFNELKFVPSKSRFGYLSCEWPTKYIEYIIVRPDPLPSKPLVSTDHPIYPDGNRAVIDFLKIRTNQAPNRIFFQIPDYRVKITNLKISGNNIKLQVDARGINLVDLIAKFYADFRPESPFYREIYVHMMHSSNLDFKDNCVEYEFEKEYKYILATVLNKKTGKLLDYREYYFSWESTEGVIFELVEPEIREIIRRGENLNVEFKQNLDNPERFLKTIVAFANTKGGRIFIGVSDDAKVIGFKCDEDKITNLISSNINPIPKFNVNVIELNTKPITLVEVLEGDNKPYSHRELGFFIRSGGTNRVATRTDMDEIYRPKTKAVI